jgi:hypothetical protein
MTFHDTVSEEEINSEVELIQSPDVLQKVVTTCGLDKKKFISSLLHPGQTRRTAWIKPSWTCVLTCTGSHQEDQCDQHRVQSHVADGAEGVSTLDDAYLEKHLDVHHPSGQFQFFDEQAEQYEKHAVSGGAAQQLCDSAGWSSADDDEGHDAAEAGGFQRIAGDHARIDRRDAEAHHRPRRPSAFDTVAHDNANEARGTTRRCCKSESDVVDARNEAHRSC